MSGLCLAQVVVLFVCPDGRRAVFQGPYARRCAPASGAAVDHGPDSMARVDARPGPLPCRAGAWPAPPASSPLMPERKRCARSRTGLAGRGRVGGGSPGGEVGAQLRLGWCKEPPLPDAGVRRFVGQAWDLSSHLLAGQARAGCKNVFSGNHLAQSQRVWPPCGPPCLSG